MRRDTWENYVRMYGRRRYAMSMYACVEATPPPCSARAAAEVNGRERLRVETAGRGGVEATAVVGPGSVRVAGGAAGVAC